MRILFSPFRCPSLVKVKDDYRDGRVELKLEGWGGSGWCYENSAEVQCRSGRRCPQNDQYNTKSLSRFCVLVLWAI